MDFATPAEASCPTSMGGGGGGGSLSNVRFSYWLRCMATKWEVAGSSLLLIPNRGLVLLKIRLAAF